MNNEPTTGSPLPALSLSLTPEEIRAGAPLGTAMTRRVHVLGHELLLRGGRCNRCYGAGVVRFVDGAWLTLARKDCKVSIQELADELGVSWTYVWALESNTKPVTGKAALKYLEAAQRIRDGRRRQAGKPAAKKVKGKREGRKR